MLKMKIFDSYSKEDVEKQVNDFLEKEKQIGIVSTDHKVTPFGEEEGNPVVRYSVAILYTRVSSLKLMQ